MTDAGTRVLVVAAHPDDEILGMGATIAVHTLRGDEVRILCLTDGSSSQYPGDEAIRAQKNEEARKAADVLGAAAYVHLDFPDMRLDTVPHVEINRAIEEQVADLRPRILYVVHPDVNLDHRAAFDSTMVATRPVPGQSVRTVLTYAPGSSVEWTAPQADWFSPNWYVDVTTTLDRKLEAFECYRTEQRDFPHPRSVRAIKARAEYAGASIGCEYAEGFVLVRTIRPA